jgi:hypothetical protein
MTDGDDWFKIYDTREDQEDSFTILKGLIDDFKKTMARSKKKAEMEAKKKKKAKERKGLQITKNKLLKIVTLDLILEYRHVLYYMSRASSLGPIKEKKKRDKLLRLATYSMEYSKFLQAMMVKLGDKKGKIEFPYTIESKDIDEMVKSHIYIEKKVLAMYRTILKEFHLDQWIRTLIKYTIDMKATNLDKIQKTYKV